jgi:hypothetical protein
MADADDTRPDFAEYGEDAVVAEDEVKSAARSCSAIIVIVMIVALVTCVMAGIAYLYD